MTLQNFKGVILLIISNQQLHVHLELLGHNIVIFGFQVLYLYCSLTSEKSLATRLNLAQSDISRKI